MSNEMIEHVARAVSPSWFDELIETPKGPGHILDNYHGQYERYRTAARDRARVAITALREPNEGMLQAVEPWLDRDNAVGFWRAMIDAALK